MSYSLSVDRASAALRRFLLLLDEQALVGTVRFGRKGGDDKAPRERRKAMLGNRWQLPYDLRIGAPFDGRPRSKDGGTSFHLSIKAVGKTRASVSGSDGSRQEGADAAAGFERYVTAGFDGALNPREFEHYLDVPPSERAEESDTPSRAVLLVSNISDDPAERNVTGCWRRRLSGHPASSGSSCSSGPARRPIGKRWPRKRGRRRRWRRLLAPLPQSCSGRSRRLPLTGYAARIAVSSNWFRSAISPGPRRWEIASAQSARRAWSIIQGHAQGGCRSGSK